MALDLVFFLVILIVVGIIVSKWIEDVNLTKRVREEMEKEKKEHQKVISKIPFEHRKCSTCMYAKNVKDYTRAGEKEKRIIAECTCHSYGKVGEFYVRGEGEGKSVLEREHIGCMDYDCYFSSFLLH